MIKSKELSAVSSKKNFPVKSMTYDHRWGGWWKTLRWV